MTAEPTRCAGCNAERHLAGELKPCPNCGSTKLYRMDRAGRKVPVTKGVDGKPLTPSTR